MQTAEGIKKGVSKKEVALLRPSVAVEVSAPTVPSTASLVYYLYSGEVGRPSTTRCESSDFTGLTRILRFIADPPAESDLCSLRSERFSSPCILIISYFKGFVKRFFTFFLRGAFIFVFALRLLCRQSALSS